MLGSLYQLDGQRFQGESPEQLTHDVAAFESRRHQLEQLIGAQWPASTCRKANSLGHQLMSAFFRKVRALNVDDWKPLSDVDRQSLTFLHVWTMAFLLAREHEPAVGTRVDAYERREAARKGNK